MPDPIDFFGQLDVDIDAFAAAVEACPLDAPVVACPGWDLADLAAHLGGVHRWVIGALEAGGPPTPNDSDPSPADAVELAAWVRTGGARMLGMLRPLAADAPVWHPFPVAKVAAVWPRRQAQEASVHRWDAQFAAGLPATISTAMSVDGIDEYLGVMLPRLVIREHLALPSSTVRFVATDTGDSWTVDGRSGSVVAAAEGSRSEATINGRAEDVLLSVWHRPIPADAVTIEGDTEVADAWLALGGA